MRVIRTSLFGRGGLRLVCFAVLGFQQLGEFVYQLRNHRHSTIRRGSVIVDLHHTALALFDHDKSHRDNGDATAAATAEQLLILLLGGQIRTAAGISRCIGLRLCR